MDGERKSREFVLLAHLDNDDDDDDDFKIILSKAVDFVHISS